MVLAICAALAIGAVLYTFWLKPEAAVAASPAERERAFLNERKEVVYENLRDLLMEYRMGKLSDKDYEQLKQHYQEQLAGLFAALEQLPGAKRAAIAPGTCPQCGHVNPPENRFCGACGRPLSTLSGPSA